MRPAAPRLVDTLTGDLYIDGVERPSKTGSRIDVLDPSTGEPLASVADAAPDEGIIAVEAAAAALPEWRRRSPRQRADTLRRAYELMTERSGELAYLISLENGKPLPDSESEVAYAAEFFRWYSEEAVRLNGRVGTAPSGQNTILVTRQPIGVCMLITPWNFPAAMATRKIAPALAAGCTVVLKPAPSTPLTAYAIAQLLTESGVPAGVVNVITTSTPGPVVSAVLHDDRVRKLSFTGSTPVGRILLAEAADHVLSCSMELGGNAPFIVLPDADLEQAVSGVMLAKMRNGGQACTAANRILVHRDIHDEFAALVSKEMAALVVGPGTDPATECGPMIDSRAVDKVHTLVGAARNDNACVLTGGRRPDRPGSFYPPTVLADVPRTSAIMSTEIFGPVASISAFDTDEDAINVANATEYGLCAYVYTTDLGRAMAMADRLDFGMVGINRGMVSDPAAPFGGFKQSGLGREGSQEGILEYTETKYIALSW